MATEQHIKSVPNKPKLTPKQESQKALFEQTLEGFTHRIQSQRFKQGKLNSAKSAVKEFVDASGMFPWDWKRDDFEEHSAYLFVKRHNAAPTQRKKQLEIKQYMDYLDSSKYKRIIQIEFGITLEPICIPGENMIVHKIENDNQTKRRDMTVAELGEFFEKMDGEILRRYDSAHKGFRSAQRDKAVYGLMADYGLRNQELRMLNITDVGPNPDQPQFGNHGYIDVWHGKGTKGSNAIYRRVWTMDMRAAENLQWYMEEVRPAFIGRRTKDIKTLFYSERGNRLSARSIEINLKEYLGIFGMDESLVPHSFRHSYMTYNQEVDGVSANVMQKMGGHAQLSTTQGYTHFSEPFIRKSRNHAIDAKLEKHNRRQSDENQTE